MAWVLMFIALTETTYAVKYFGHFESMDDCMAAREELVEEAGRPIINYQAICIPHKFAEDA